MEQSPSSEANRFSSSQEIPRILRNPNVHYRTHKCLLPVPNLSHINPGHTPYFTSCRSIFIFSSHLHLVLPGGLFPSAFPTKTLYTLILSLNVLHVPPISFFSLSSLELHWVRINPLVIPEACAVYWLRLRHQLATFHACYKQSHCGADGHQIG